MTAFRLAIANAHSDESGVEKNEMRARFPAQIPPSPTSQQHVLFGDAIAVIWNHVVEADIDADIVIPALSVPWGT